MSDIKWIKINTNMFEDEKIRLIDAMPERDTIHYVWVRLLVQAGKTNAKGFIFLSENIPYTEEMLSTIFSRPINSIRLSLKVLRDFGMIEIDNENRIKIAKWEKHQNVEGMDKIREQTKKRVEKCRERKKLLSSNVTDDRCNATVTKQNKIKKENKEIEKDRDTEKEVYVERDGGMEEERHTERYIERYIEGDRETEVGIYREAHREIEEKDMETEVRYIEAEPEVTYIEKPYVQEMRKRQTEENREIQIEENNGTDIDLYKDINSCSENNISSYKEKSETGKSNDLLQIHTNSEVEGILNYYSNVADEIFGFDFKAVKIAVATYGERYVRLAINRALEVNKPNIMYINGILRNWKRSGYPEENESKSGFYKKDSNDNYYNKDNSYNKNNNYRTFNNFPPREYDYDKLEKSLLGWN